MFDIDNNIDFIRMFERKLANYCGSKYAVCTDCCTNAILISLYMKTLLGELSKDDTLYIPARTYMSVPMTLKLFGFKVKLAKLEWWESYDIMVNGYKSTGVIDSAVSFFENMIDHKRMELFCLSFQQKKRLNLGRGGAILTNNQEYYELLKRLVHDGRNPAIYHGDENPKDICVGFHAYLDPERAAKGIMLLNQKHLLPEYKRVTSGEYPDLTRLGVFDEE